MNPAHVHLLLNHFPIIGTIIGLLVLIAAFLLKNTTVRRVALAIFVGTALLCIPAYLSGEGAEERVEHLQGVTESAIEDHEEAAKFGLIVTLVLGGVSALALFASVKERSYASLLSFIVLAIALANMGIMYRVGNSGGLIRHSEIAGASAPSGNTEQNPPATQQGSEKKKDSDDD